MWTDVEFLDATLLSSASGSHENAKSANSSGSDASADEEDEQSDDASPSGARRSGGAQLWTTSSCRRMFTRGRRRPGRYPSDGDHCHRL